MSTAKSRIRAARPPLKLVAPLSYHNCWGYSTLNILLGSSLISAFRHLAPIGAASILSYRAWGLVFLTLGLLTAFGLVTNRWMFTRHLQLVAVFIKSVWAFALVLESFITPQTWPVTLVWLCLLYLQIVTWLYFLPPRAEVRRV